jgi:hypothetical protein
VYFFPQVLLFFSGATAATKCDPKLT